MSSEWPGKIILSRADRSQAGNSESVRCQHANFKSQFMKSRERFPMTRILFLAGLVTMTLMAGCSEKPIDHDARFDTRVEESWTKDSQWIDAVELLSSGGAFIDTGEPDGQLLDTPHVLPVLKRLSEEFGLEWQAITEEVNPTQALAIVAKLPENTSIREKFEAALKLEQKSFPGSILYQWGHRWLSISFLNQEQSDMIEQGMK